MAKLGVMIHGVELGHIDTNIVVTIQRNRYLSVVGYGAEPCYFGIIAYDAEQRV